MSILKEVLSQTYLPPVKEGQPKKKTKLDELVEFEKEIQQKWAEAHAFEVDALPEKAPKYMATCPYPYMNGRLHMGHMFTVSKSCFSVFYHRLKGEKALYPFGFHCTGMPIKACSDKLRNEVAKYGESGPPHLSEDEKIAKREEVRKGLEAQINSRLTKKPSGAVGGKKANAKPKADPTKHKASKSKANAKKGVGSTQWEIMRSLGMTDEEILKFTDPQHWLKFFPKHCKSDLDCIGAGIDWRRSFITTDTNPYYDSFVRWQFTLLNERNHLLFGSRPTIFSPKDGQPCMDHDRSSGEGVGVTSYTLIKMKVQDPLPACLEPVKDFNVYAVPATLRSETMYGQTNCWVSPTGTYGVFQVNEKDVFICSHRAARNMAFQGLSLKEKEVTCLIESITGAELVGCMLDAPLSKMGVVRMLPMASVSMNKGTGVVTSVPSDSVDDYANVKYLQDKEKIRNDFNVKEEWVTSIEIVPIMETPFGNLSAPAAYEQFKISSPKDANKLALAKEETYKAAFYQGKMLVGDFAGKSVQDCKDDIVKAMSDAGTAVPYHEPEGEVISRTNDVCVVAITDQWYLNYGAEEWKAATRAAVEELNLYHPETESKVRRTVDWLHEWPCSRTYGLGTKLPIDEKWLIESLSDSTIYMAYYTISHLLHEDVFGAVPGPAGIKPEQLTREVYDHIFCDAEYPEGCGIEKETLAKLRQEFNFWYPMDLRASGKDLVGNHLTFCVFNHVATWPNDPSKWPRSIRSNGHMKLNNEKMSKQTGNFLTVVDCVELFGADASRFTVAQAGDGGDNDANFECDVANKTILKLHSTIVRASQLLKEEKDELLEERDIVSFADRSFEDELNRMLAECDAEYLACNFRTASIIAFREMNSVYTTYKAQCDAAGVRLNAGLVRRFIEAQAIMMVPITPHWSEKIWQILGNDGFAVHATWPEASPVDAVLSEQTEYLRKCMDQWILDVQKSKKALKGVKVTVAVQFPDWVKDTYALALSSVVEQIATAEKEVLSKLKADPSLRRHMKLAGPLAKKLVESVQTEASKSIQCKHNFDEAALLNENLAYIQNTLASVRSKNSKDPFEVVISTELEPKAKQQPIPYAPILATINK